MAALVASLALFGASALASTVGSAIVQNQCDYPIYLSDVPASGGGYSTSSQWLSAGGTWSQQYTILNTAGGWSIKLSKSESLSNIMQYEYTYQGDSTIWYDLSDVNGNPWDGDWTATSNEASCVPRHAAYMYSTDDANGMQSCDASASVTVILCNGTSSSSSAVSVASAPSETAVVSSAAAPSTPSSTYTAPQATSESVGVVQDDNVLPASTPTTMATYYTSSTTDGPVVVVETAMDVVTAYVTAYATPEAKRHVHHPHQRHEAEA